MSDIRAEVAEPLVRVEGLVKHFPVKAGLFHRGADKIHAVNGVSFSILRGKTLGLVGESGCGKTTTGRLLLRVHEPDDGTLRFDSDLDFFAMPPGEMREVRRRMQYIFQDPFGSLNPKMQVRDIVTEPLCYRRPRPASGELDRRAEELLDLVGIAKGDVRKYPHEFSGGQRQRISIARALAPNPDFVVCDEPVSSLDMSIQSQILNLLNALQRELTLTYLFIAHDFPVVFYMSDDVAVMYAGRIVEYGPSKALAAHPRHPYTRLLMAAHDKDASDSGDLPDLRRLPTGCTFYDRCPIHQDRCKTAFPPPVLVGDRHQAACYRASAG